MQTSLKTKTVKISHLKWCLEQLQYKQNQCDEVSYDYIYQYIYDTIYEMEHMETEAALRYYRKQMDANIRDTLLKYNIELSV